ncbi:RNA-binding S4 domain-containing protein [Mycoplasma tauri]|uniref:RNA-binding S4 domain-containing protein n=1 Tax=Mycoplasma tauri TaxID=547987 RepID=UPI001CBEE456|nr:RNA-binding S4 domain-containing protein [Mycoplasma tauri]MBZ4218329.1 RNA-binding S4 domain-containing protein [Mycoplasma tauri]
MDPIIYIKGKYIGLGKLIKKMGLISTGGEIKGFLQSNSVKINDKVPLGRNSKVFIGDLVWINNNVYYIKELN